MVECSDPQSETLLVWVWNHTKALLAADVAVGDAQVNIHSVASHPSQYTVSLHPPGSGTLRCLVSWQSHPPPVIHEGNIEKSGPVGFQPR